MLCVDLTLIWALIRPFEQRSKHFDGNRGFLSEPWANPHWEAEEAGPTCPPSQPLQWQHKRGQAGVPVPAPACCQSTLRSGALSAALLGEPASPRSLGKRPTQLLWGGKSVCMLSCPENNVGAWHPHLGIPGPDIQPLIIPWPASHLVACIYLKKLCVDLVGHTIAG